MSSNQDEYDFEDDFDSKTAQIQRYRLKYQPPTLIIEYTDITKKRLQRRIKFKNPSTHSTTAEDIASKLLIKNYDIISRDTVSYQQLVDLVNLLLFSDISETSSMIDDIMVSKLKGGVSGVNGEVDLNKVSETENAKAKEIMSYTFETKRLKPTDEGFIYDKRVDFEPPNETCEWDDE